MELRALTGIRGFAALWVMAFHFNRYLPDLFPQADRFITPVVAHGFLGVDLFFYLSGFIMSHTYLDQWRAKLDLASARRFWRRRFARVVPVYIATTAIAIALWIRLGSIGYTAKVMHLNPLRPSLVALNVLGLQQWAALQSLNFPGWSVSAELFAYLCCPGLAWIVIRIAKWRHGSAVLVASAVFTYATLIYAFMAPTVVNGRMVQISCEFSIGFIANVLVREWRIRLTRRAAGIAFAVALAGCMFVPNPAQAAFRAVSILWLVVIITFYLSPGILTGRAWVTLGHWSYSLYLLHGLQIYALIAFHGPWISHHASLNALEFVALFAGPIALAAVFYTYIEEPARRWLTKKKPAPVLAAAR